MVDFVEKPTDILMFTVFLPKTMSGRLLRRLHFKYDFITIENLNPVYHEIELQLVNLL